ncbi:MAG: sigma-70 family RNA polymerase sigma factor [Chloroflexota bacterium]|nr:MAG: sigma-70 family RNA polymerase sigma factor [Chloroflexota bacterium]
MSSSADLQLLTLSGLRHRCAAESDRFFNRQEHDPRYCFELFKRAIDARDDRAWASIYEQYRPLVTGWVERHSLFSAADEETQYFVNRAFEKMWTAITPAKFENFSDLKSILSYLQMCVHSALVDYLRGREQAALFSQEHLAQIPDDGSSNVEARVGKRVEREELWRWINERLKSEKERRVIYGTFVLAMKPRELHAQFAGTFDNVNEVYRIKENVMARLRRDKDLAKIFGAGWLDAGESSFTSVYDG